MEVLGARGRLDENCDLASGNGGFWVSLGYYTLRAVWYE